MRKRKMFWLMIVALVAITIGGAFFAALSSSSILLPQAGLQRIIDTKLPYDAGDGLMISRVRINLGERAIGISLTAQLSKFGAREVLQGRAVGSLFYQPSDGSLYFRLNDFRLTNVEIGSMSLPDQILSYFHSLLATGNTSEQPILLKREAQMIHDSFLDAAQRSLARTPVYTLPKTLAGRAARLGLRSVQVKDGFLVVQISFFNLNEVLEGFGLGVLVIFGFGLSLIVFSRR